MWHEGIPCLAGQRMAFWESSEISVWSHNNDFIVRHLLATPFKCYSLEKWVDLVCQYKVQYIARLQWEAQAFTISGSSQKKTPLNCVEYEKLFKNYLLNGKYKYIMLSFPQNCYFFHGDKIFPNWYPPSIHWLKLSYVPRKFREFWAIIPAHSRDARLMKFILDNNVYKDAAISNCLKKLLNTNTPDPSWTQLHWNNSLLFHQLSHFSICANYRKMLARKDLSKLEAQCASIIFSTNCIGRENTQ